MSKTIGPYRLNPRGDYNPAADPLYSLLDLVSDGGGSFVYINDTPSNEPTSSASHWQQIASVGGQDLVDAAVAARDAAMGYAAQLAAGIGSPAGAYDDLAALNTANPAHDRTYLTKNDWKLAYYDAIAGAFVAGGVYQAASVVGDIDKINDRIFNIESATIKESDYIAQGSFTINGQAYSSTMLFPIDFIQSGDTYTIRLVHSGVHLAMVYEYGTDNTPRLIDLVGPASGVEYTRVAQHDLKGFSFYNNTPFTDETFNITVKKSILHTDTLEHKVEALEQAKNEFLSFDRLIRDGFIDGEILVNLDECEIGATVNNESGNTTYIYKNLYFSLIGGRNFGLAIRDVEGARRAVVVSVYYTDSSETLIKQEDYSSVQLKNGARLICPSGATSIRIRLYPSVNGGLSDVAAKYKGILLFSSGDGVLKIRNRFNDTPIDNIPSYYFCDNYLDSKVTDIRDLIRSADGNYDAFFFCTDFHWPINQQHSPALIKYISSKTRINRLFCGGDFADGINVDSLNAFRDAFGGRIYNVAGNHEYMDLFAENSSTVAKTILAGDVWAWLNGHMTDAVTDNPHGNYYYADNVTQKIRYIVLSVYSDGEVWSYDGTQDSWLDATLQNLPDGYQAIVFVHHIANVIFPTLEATLSPGGVVIAETLDAHAADVLCVFCGHLHIDTIMRTAGGIPIISTTCDKNTPYDANEEAHFLSAGGRNTGTINEQAIDVVIVNRASNKIDMVRIGCPARVGLTTGLEERSVSIRLP